MILSLSCRRSLVFLWIILTGKVASDISSPILDIINTAPIDKRIYLEQILFYASQLYENDQAEEGK